MRKWIVVGGLSLFALVAVGLALPRAVAPAAIAPAVTVEQGVPVGGAHAEAAPWRTLPSPLAMDAELAALFGPLDGAADEQAYQHALSRALLQLRARLRSDPAMVGKVEAMLRTIDRQQPVARIAVGALAGAGTPESQAAMVRLTEARAGDHEFLELMVPMMGFAQHPTPETEAALRRIGGGGSGAPSEVQQMAQLALGTMAQRLATEDPARARGIVDSYGARLEGAKEASEVRTYLSVLGNAGGAEAGRFLARYLDDERSDVRAQALDALRRVPTAEAEAALVAAVRTEPDGAARASAAEALGYRAPSAALTGIEADALAAEADGAVAGRLLDALWAQREGGDPERALAAVEAAAKSHPVAAVRDQAKAYLAQLGSRG